jgi:hypothetical protein
MQYSPSKRRTVTSRQFFSIEYYSTQINSTQLNSIQFNSIQFGRVIMCVKQYHVFCIVRYAIPVRCPPVNPGPIHDVYVP